MTGELTLKIDQTLIEKTTEYAAMRGLSLSRLVEAYLASLVRDAPKATGVVAELAGLLEGVELGDVEDDDTRYLSRKYS